MDLKLTALIVALIGLALLVTGTILLFGRWALVADGAVLVIAGLVPDWERIR